MSLQFLNPWIGRMNRQQFLAGAFICGGAMYLGTEYIPEPALVVVFNFFFGFMLFIFVFRRLSDQQNDGIAHILDRHSIGFTPQDTANATYKAIFIPLLIARGSSGMDPVLACVLMIMIGAPLAILFMYMANPALIILGIFIFFIFMAAGNPESNAYGYPPVGLDFRTTIPATYPDALAEQFDARERELQEQLERVKATRKAKTSDSSHYVDFRGRA